ncbi:helix-turn-helix domain-containing protein [Streptomyces sp. S1]|uniref:helix-turn-helix transcriptional regulator n=1 Tax=Streptomyces sp. S1 TaxID=718288 RepID=UPI003D73A113
MYEERPALLAGAVLWTAETDPAAPAHPILPDGCMDLIRADGRLLVAGPDTRAHVPTDTAARYAGLRFAPGDAPRELRDALWDGAEARRTGERITDAPDPAAALEEFVRLRAAGARPAPAGRPVAETADAVGLGARRLHRRSLDAFGYGPKTLARILRLQRALALVRSGVPYAETAARTGCADQAHLSREVRALTGTTLGAYTASSASANNDTAHPSGSSTTA